MLGEMMYVVDDQTVDDAVGTNAIKAGTLVDYESATSGWIQLPKGSLGQGVVKPDATKVSDGGADGVAAGGFASAAARKTAMDKVDAVVDLVNELKGIIDKYVA